MAISRSEASPQGRPAARPLFRRVLVANRGEIAVRVIRACRELGIDSVAVYSEADRTALHVQQADRAYAIGPAPAAESYLHAERILAAAREAGADAIHPGYGFLAENPAFARQVAAAGITFIGPSPEAIARMGDKVAARKLMMAAGVPVVPGSAGELRDPAAVERAARETGFPVMLKAVGGGGGKGMRLVRNPAELAGALRAVRSEAGSSFADERVYLERYIERPRHVEVQILGDRGGKVVHLYERECTIQRRHQKVLEESPSTAIDAATRAAMGEVAVRAARAVGYVGAGTVEFLLDRGGRFYFLEMNTRIQVEHPVTEMVTGVDLVKAQIEIAAGRPLALRQEDIAQRGWAIECRIYAEDPDNGFFPSPGRIELLRLPGGAGIRDDSGVYEGFEVSVHYDPMISKLVAWGRTRDEAISRMQRALHEYVVLGPTTNIALHRWILSHPRFLASDLDTGFIGDEYRGLAPDHRGEVALIAAAVSAAERWRQRSQVAAKPGRRSRWRDAARREGLRE